MNSLVALGTLATWAYSTVALFAPALLPAASRAVHFEAAAVIVTLILLGRWMEARAWGQTGAAIEALIELTPDTARVEEDGAITERPTASLSIGAVIHARPGERIAVDGEVISGTRPAICRRMAVWGANAVLAISDAPRDTSAAAIAALRGAGVETAMISGDRAAAARHMADRLGIGHVSADLRPEDKVAALADLRARFGTIAFVGDGINDAPAPAQADVGIAMGGGTDVAIEAADIVLMSGDPMGVVTARHVSVRTLANIRQNLFWAFAYNAALIPVAAGVLYPSSGAMLSPMLAAGAVALSSVFVLGNALRLRRLRRPGGAMPDPA